MTAQLFARSCGAPPLPSSTHLPVRGAPTWIRAQLAGSKHSPCNCPSAEAQALRTSGTKSMVGGGRNAPGREGKFLVNWSPVTGDHGCYSQVLAALYVLAYAPHLPPRLVAQAHLLGLGVCHHRLPCTQKKLQQCCLM